MSQYWYKAFITKLHKFALIDGGGDIRASSPDLEGIMLAKQHYGWGTIHRMKFTNKTIKIGTEVK